MLPFAVFGNEVLCDLEWSSAAQNIQLNRWVKSGQLVRLKRGLYTLPSHYQKQKFSHLWLANTLYSPSYLSLEYVLSMHDLIPERVEMFTSVSLNKTALFTNKLGRFQYRKVKKNLFFGFEERLDENNFSCLVALPEKALLDLVYLTSNWQPTKDYLLQNIRLQQFDQFKKKRLVEYSKKFNCKKIDLTVNVLLKMY
ncbi:MAG: type IV toxin-antitoxin system AbiEi family antitoxin domain-containing protein [Deltaproteobacteria bacterium]|nr:type IV toxin-antitoxin system AbiEi family antitoxin domain-containing protein [Deltaproteobacteria bacterium]